MKRLVLIVPDDFDAGSVISLIGRDLIQAHIGEYVPAKPQVVTKPNGVHSESFSEPVIETGRLVAPYSHTPGHTRRATTRNRVPKMTLKSIVEDIGREIEWFSAKDVEAKIQAYGYKEDSGYKVLSTMKCNEQIEWNSVTNKYRLLTTASLVEF